MRLSKAEAAFLLLLLLFTTGVAGLLYLDYNRRVDAGKNRVVGELIIKRNRAERKYTRQVVWEDLSNSVPLYNRDAIRTGKLSEAIIKLLDGTEIVVEENSMIVLNISDQKAMDINFEYGSVQAARSKSGDTKVNIKKGDKTISISDSDVSLSGSEGDELSLVVKRGEATLESGGKTEKLEENQSAKIADEGIQIRKISVLPVSPEDGGRVFASGNRATVPFRWKSDASQALLEISQNRNFTAVSTRKRNVNGDSTGLELTSGSYYWRVSAVNPQNGAREYSNVARFSVIERTPVMLYSPANGTTIPSPENTTFVNFVWSESSLATGYTLEIARDASFSNRVDSIDSYSTSVATRLSPGAYYWKVRTRSPVKDAVTESDPRRFVVTMKREIPVPRPIRPENGRQVSGTLMREQGVTFQWIADPLVKNVEIEFARSSDFGNTVVARGSSGAGFYTLKSSLSPGTYYWRVRGTGSGGRNSDYSGPLAFNLAATGQIQLLNPRPGENLSGSDAKSRGVHYTWERLPQNGQYRITISRQADLSSPLETERTASGNFKGKFPGEGLFYWQVALQIDNETVARSEVGSFQIQENLNDPVLTFPSRGSLVNMEKRDNLPFQWEPVEGATRYTFRLYEIKNARRSRILEVERSQPGFTLSDLTLLDVGQFAWSVTAHGLSSGGRKLDSRETLLHFSISLGDQKAPEILSPEKQYLEKEVLKPEDLEGISGP